MSLTSEEAYGAECGMRPIGIDLFAGAGGLSLGFEQAGFDVKAAVEIDPVHCAAHKFNFPHTAVLARSVEGLTGDEIRQAAGIGSQRVDCVFGGAPCQGFSMIGHRVLDDPRNRLVLDFVRIVRELDAETFVFENVKGLTVGRHKHFLEELVRAFDVAGYNCRLPWKVLNAGHYGTPQSRERLILMGAKKGRPLPHYPDATTNIAGKKERFPSLPLGPTSRDALDDLPDAEGFATLMSSDAVTTSKLGNPSVYAAELRGLSNSAWHYGHPRDWNPAILTSSARTVHTDISRRRFAETEPGTVEPISRLFRLPTNGVSNTLRAGTDGARGAFTSPRPNSLSLGKVRHCSRNGAVTRFSRLVPVQRHEVARRAANREQRSSPTCSRRGNSNRCSPRYQAPSPPSEYIFRRPCPSKLRPLHCVRALRVVAPRSRRDRKSGATKRRQIDIGRESSQEGLRPMAKALNRYEFLIEKVFVDRYEKGATSLDFTREDIEDAASFLNIKLPKNLGDVLYSFQFRNALPAHIVATQPEGMEWVIELAGRALYKFSLVRANRVLPREDLVRIDIPDATPELIRAYALDDEQALLAIVRYNRLIDTFLGLTTYSLQNHLRTTVKGIGQIEIDELYVGLDKRGCHYVIPVQAKGGKDQIGIVQISQDIRFVEDKFPGMRCRAIAAQFMENEVIALFELTLQDDEIKVVEERHYRLVPAKKLDGDAIRNYRD